jgi:hypothetical protein
MTRDSIGRRRSRVDDELKAMFEAKAAEPVPDGLLGLVDSVDAPVEVTKVG